MPKRPPRLKGPKDGGYKPDGQPGGYTPARRTRRAPKAYWRRNPYPDGFGRVVTGAPQPLPDHVVQEWDDLIWDQQIEAARDRARRH